MEKDRIVAIGLLTQSNLDALGPAFRRLWPLDDAGCFAELLDAIDKADRARAGDIDDDGAKV